MLRIPPSLPAVLLLAGTILAQGHDAAPNQPQPAPQPVLNGTAEAGASTAAAASMAASGCMVPVHTAAADNGLAYGTWAAGHDYKVSFHDGMTWVPYLGRDYPHNQPFAWRTLSVRVGGTELLDGTPPVHHQADFRYEYRYGSVIEAYDVLAHGLEQSFVLAARPAATGDLVVRGAVQSLLRCADAAPAHQALRFCDAQGRAILDYGRAFAVDAGGREIEVPTACDDGVITLQVPAAFLATATFPLTIDPLLTPVTLQLGTTPAESVDLVRDDLGNQLLQSYVRFTSAADADAYGRLYPDGWGTGGAGTLVFSDVTTSWSTPETSCSLCGPQNKFVIGLVREVSAPAIRVWAEPTSTTTLVTTVVFGTYSSTRSDWQVAVGGIEKYNQSGSAASGTHALIVFQRDASGTPGSNLAESEIWGALLDCSATPATFGTEFEIGSTSSGLDSEHPDVNKFAEGGSPTTWVVAYQEYNNGIANDDWDLIARQVDSTGAIPASYWFPSVAAGTHKIEPKIDGQRGRYCVFHCRVDQTTLTKISGYAGLNVDAERFDWPAGGSITRYPATLAIGTSSTGSRYLRVLDNAYDTDTDSFWVGLWHAAGAGSRSLFLTRVGHHGWRVESVTIAPGTNNFTGGACCYDDDANSFPLTYGNDDAGATNPLFGNVLEFPAETAPTLAGTGCSPATLAWRGFDQNGVSTGGHAQQIGHQYVGVAVTGAPAGVAHFMQLSFGTANVVVPSPIVPSTCRLLIDPGSTYLGALPLAIGSDVSWTFPLPESLPPLTIHLQDWHLDAAATQVFSTQRLTVPLIR